MIDSTTHDAIPVSAEELERLRADAKRLKHLHDDPMRAQAYFWNHKGRKERTAAIDSDIAALATTLLQCEETKEE